MLASGLVAGVLAGLAVGGDIRRLASIQLRLWPLLVAAVVLRAIAATTVARPLPYLASFVTVVLVAAANTHLPGIPLVAIGAILNTAVIALNGGMPVDPAAALAANFSGWGDGLHVRLGVETRLAFFVDIIPVSIIRGVYSPGDLLIAAGSFWLMFSRTRRP